jgi:hypothetical protein
MEWLLSNKLTLLSAVGSVVVSRCVGRSVYRDAATASAVFIGLSAIGAFWLSSGNTWERIKGAWRSICSDQPRPLDYLPELIPVIVVGYKLVIYWGALLATHNLIIYGLPLLPQLDNRCRMPV